MAGTSKKKKSRKNRTKAVLISVASVLVVAAAAVVFVLFNPFAGKILQGVSVSGVSVSGMTKKEAQTALSARSDELLAKTEISISVNGQIVKYTAKDLGLSVDYEATTEQALAYGHSGTSDERKQAENTAATNGINLAVRLTAEKNSLKSTLASVKTSLDKMPVDASCTFMPRGYNSDGSKYVPDEEALITAASKGTAVVLPDTLVRNPADQMPNKLRYEFYKDSKYIKDYIPTQSNVSRFLYQSEVVGVSVDVDGLADGIIAQLKTGNYSTPVAAPGTTTQPSITLDALKKNTQLIASWTSSYASHNNANRNSNVAKLSGFVNGSVVQPGEEWSINKLTGIRTKAKGWKDAPGIQAGGFIDQPGGGVCQVSSTVYNAAIRSNLEITDSSHHSIVSSYIPIGLDATISSGEPDLKFKNNQSTPVYIVSYTNPVDKNITVEIYGQTVKDTQYGDIIITFTAEDLGTYGGTPVMNYVYNATASFDGTPIPAGGKVVYAEVRPGRKAQTYRHILSLDGTELKNEKFTYFQWRPINGTTYVNGPDPATQPSPSPGTSPSPTT